MYGYLRVASAFPELKVGDILFNKQKIIDEIINLNEKSVKVVVFPELSITSCSLYDLFFDCDILSNSINAVCDIATECKDFDMLILLSFPFKIDGHIYSATALIKSGEIIAIIPRKKIKNTKVLSNKNFSDGKNKNKTVDIKIDYETKKILFDSNVVVNIKNYEDLTLSVVFDGEFDDIIDTNILLNPSIMSEEINIDNEINILKTFSKKNNNLIITSAPNFMESTSKYIFFSRAYIFEYGNLLIKNDSLGKNSIIADVDVDILLSKKKKNINVDNIHTIDINFNNIDLNHKNEIFREISKEPYILTTNDSINTSNRIINILAVALMKRMSVTKSQNIVIGVSGGIDSTLALFICNKTKHMMKNLNVDIIAINMPCFGTTNRSLENVNGLCSAMNINLKTIDITESIKLHFKNIEHDLNNTNLTFENAQARERTKILMDIANDYNGIVVGTSDMSESALGFSTYNGDQMSMYNLISSIPKTLAKKILKNLSEYYKNENIVLSNVLENIVSMPISPELLPTISGVSNQNTESIIGDYILHDFFMYYYLNYNFSIEKIYDLSLYAFENEYSEEHIKKCLNIFFDRFFKMQFKRNATADSPYIGIKNVDKELGFSTVSDTEICKRI